MVTTLNLKYHIAIIYCYVRETQNLNKYRQADME